jgi:hypothetical protein
MRTWCLTGVEAVSNGVMAFKEPASVTARLTLTVAIGILAVMLAGMLNSTRSWTSTKAISKGQPRSLIKMIRRSSGQCQQYHEARMK